MRDASNDDPAFVRNRVRHELLPLCAEVAGRDPVPLLARQAGVLRDEVALLDALAADALPDPADARRVAPPPAGPWLAARCCAAGCAGETGRRRHPPSLAEVDRVLDVAAGDGRRDRAGGGPPRAPLPRAPRSASRPPSAPPVVSRR